MKKITFIILLSLCFSTLTYSSNKTETPAIKNTSIFNKPTSVYGGDTRPKYRIGFNAPKIDHRQILLTIDEKTTDGFDWGYDGEIYQIFSDDMYWLINSKKYVIQATNLVFVGKQVSLGIITAGGDITIKIDEIVNPIDGIKVGLIDKVTNIVYDLQQADFTINLAAGEYHERFAITFISAVETTTTEDATVADTTTTSDANTSTDTDTSSSTDSSTSSESDTTTADNSTSTDDTTTADSSTENSTTTESDTTTANSSTEDSTVAESDTVTADSSTEDSTVAESDTTTTDEAAFENEKEDKLKLVIYVNKNGSLLNIKNQKELKLYNVVLYNKLGQNINSWSINSNSKTTELSLNQSDSVCLVQVNTELGRVIKRVYINNK
ncbi:hypothetical protein [Lutibacter sp.]|uniref:hypothetical protein n=1 Tax=Lutibacter sp. TaxID=1925666 RepID=UPI003566B798